MPCTWAQLRIVLALMTLGRSGSFALGGLLTGFSDDAVHAPWMSTVLNPYLDPIVDHTIERIVALERYKTISGK